MSVRFFPVSLNTTVLFSVFMLFSLTSSNVCGAARKGPFALLQSMASPIQKPSSAPIKACVRVDMTGDAAAEGMSAVFPVSFSPLRIVTEEQKKRYGNFGLPPEGYEFSLKQGYWQLVNEDGLTAVSYELVFPPFNKPIIKGLLRAANPGVYSDLNLDKELGTLGVTGWGIEGNDVSSLLRLPFKTEPSARVSSEKAILFMTECEPPNGDPDKFSISGADIAMANGYAGLGMWNMVYSYLEDKRDYQKCLMKEKPDYAKAVEVFFEREICDRADEASPIARALDIDLLFSKTKKANFSLKSITATVPNTSIAELDTSNADVRYRLSCWPFTESSGYLSLSSLSEPGKGPLAGEMLLYLTPLSLQNERLASLALRRETVRAFRTKLLFHGMDDFDDGLIAPLTRPNVEPSLRESLLRMNRALWEYMAVKSAHSSFSGANTLGDIPPAARAKLNNARSAALQKVMRPARGTVAGEYFDEHHNPSYVHPFNSELDGIYSRAVYHSWQNWDESVKTRTDEAIIDLLSNGYTRDTKSPAFAGYVTPDGSGTFEEATKGYLFSSPSGPDSTSIAATAYSTYVKGSPKKFLGRLGWDVLKAQFTDLQWLSQATVPKNGATQISVSSLETNTMTPLLFPFFHARASRVCQSLVGMVDGTDTDGLGKIKSIDGLPWTTSEPDLYCYVNDKHSIEKLEAICNAILSDPVGKSKNPVIPSTTYEYVTTSVLPDRWASLYASPTTSLPAKFEARRYYQHIARLSVTQALNRLKEEDCNGTVGIVKTHRFGFQEKLLKIQTDWDSGPIRATAGTEGALFALQPVVADRKDTDTAVVRTVERIFGTINDFIDKTRYLQRPNDNSQTGIKDKNELFKRLEREVLIKPSLVPHVLWGRYLRDFDEYGFRAFARRLTLAAHGLSANERAKRKIEFIQAPSSTGSTQTRTIVRP